jgi:hypothetical protein
MQNNVGIYASQISGHLYDGPYGAYDSLATVTLSAATSTITFAGIPSGYKHLQVRYMASSASGSANDQIILRFNGDASSANYTTHQLQGNGSAASAYGYGTGGYAGAYLDKALNGTGTNIFGVGVTDLLDYANTNKYKTMRSLQGYDANGSGFITLQSALWLNTGAITSITAVLNSASNFNIYSSFALYGVK